MATCWTIAGWLLQIHNLSTILVHRGFFFFAFLQNYAALICSVFLVNVVALALAVVHDYIEMHLS